MLWPERKLIAFEVLVSVLLAALLAATTVAVWRLCTVLPPAIIALLAAAPLGGALRLAPTVPTLPHRFRVWHARTLSRWLTTATARRWDSTPERWNGQEDG